MKPATNHTRLMQCVSNIVTVCLKKEVQKYNFLFIVQSAGGIVNEIQL